jgi:heterodisulfide reductase subunit C
VAVCPSARFTDEFNPRKILLKALLGAEDELTGPDSPIWLCTNCYSCYERCPQDVRPIEVIIALKNMAVEKETAPANLAKLSENIAQTGVSVTVTSAVNRRRQELGLPELKTTPIEELTEILTDKEPTKDTKEHDK